MNTSFRPVSSEAYATHLPSGENRPSRSFDGVVRRDRPGPDVVYHGYGMGTLSIALPPRERQTAFNEQRWSELITDVELARYPGRIETDRHGHIVMTPPPSPRHGSLQSKIAHLLQVRTADGRVITECPISTADGVKSADVAWASAAAMSELGDRVSFPRAPELCVEVLSPGNTDAEIREKVDLYFDAGAREVWTCAESGAVTFLRAGETTPSSSSQLFPDFPSQVVLS